METRSEDTVFVVSMTPEDAERVARPLRDRGWRVETEANDPATACWRIGECRPHAVVISLDEDPATGCDLACALNVADITSDIPVVILGGTSEDLAVLSDRVPQALFLEATEVPWVLKQLLFKH